MRIWIVTIGEPLPIDGESPRLHRSGILIDYLLKRGHVITWWNSDFDHQNRHLRYRKTTILKYTERYEIVLLHGGGYKNNVSWQRIKDHQTVAAEFVRLAKHHTAPDVIVASFPTIELCEAALAYGRANNIPVIIDYRDMWPEAFVNLIPKILHPIGNMLFSPVHKRVSKIFQLADGIVGISKPFADAALSKAGRELGKNDAVIHLGYPGSSVNQTTKEDTRLFWKERGIEASNEIFRICFFGNIARRNLKLSPVIQAADLLKKRNIPVQFIFCGKGDGLQQYLKEAEGISSIIFPGFINAHQIRSLMSISDVGILPYSPSVDFNNSIPNKAIEYLSGGLPVLTSLYGHLGELLTKHDCGYIYPVDDAMKLSSIVEHLVKTRNTLETQKNNALALFNTAFSADVEYGKMCELIQNITLK